MPVLVVNTKIMSEDLRSGLQAPAAAGQRDEGRIAPGRRSIYRAHTSNTVAVAAAEDEGDLGDIGNHGNA